MTELLSPGAQAPLPRLGPDDVHVWSVSVEEQRDRRRACEAVLDASERERAARFHHDRDRIAYVVAHAALRVTLARYLKEDPRRLRFAAGTWGKPQLSERRASRLDFNLSHSGDVVLIAVACGRAVGIDVERRLEFDYDDVASLAFSEAERRALAALRAEEKAAGFFAGWTRKEAYIKATGFGVSQGLTHFDVSLAPGSPARLLADRRVPVASWTLIDVPVPPGYSAALVGEGADWDVATFRFTHDCWGAEC